MIVNAVNTDLTLAPGLYSALTSFVVTDWFSQTLHSVCHFMSADTLDENPTVTTMKICFVFLSFFMMFIL